MTAPLPSVFSKAALGAFLAFVASVVSVVSGTARGNVVGADMQNFNPSPSGLDYVTVHSSETLAPGIFNLGIFADYGVNTLPYYEANPQNRTRYNDSVLGGDLNVGVGLLKGWDLGLSLPQILDQRIDDRNSLHGEFSSKGNTEIRATTEVHLLGEKTFGVAAVATAGLNRIRRNPYTGSDGAHDYSLSLVADTVHDALSFAVNAGYRWRTAGEPVAGFPSHPLPNQVLGSVATSYRLTDIDTKLIAEIYGARPVRGVENQTERQLSVAEFLFGAKHDLSDSLALHVGGGSELFRGTASADWRAYLGLNWTTGPIFSRPHPIKAPPPTIEQSTTTRESWPIADEDPFAGPTKLDERIIIPDILFEYDSDLVTLEGADNTLARLVKYLNQAPKFQRLVIEGHTCSLGSAEYNLKLSRRRADAIKKILVERYGVDPKAVMTAGYGLTKPIANNNNYQGRQRNRRVEFRIVRQ